MRYIINGQGLNHVSCILNPVRTNETPSVQTVFKKLVLSFVLNCALILISITPNFWNTVKTLVNIDIVIADPIIVPYIRICYRECIYKENYHMFHHIKAPLYYVRVKSGGASILWSIRSWDRVSGTRLPELL